MAAEAWGFMKEISSDGDVSTVDVIYPAFPFFAKLAPDFFRRIILPLLTYANNGTAAYGLRVEYNLTWAPHHLGHWPVCDLPPTSQEQMPVEESGNMLIMIAAIAKTQAATTWLAPYWPVLTAWADFNVVSLPDPGSQLCTDDFEGKSPHNTNLAIKGIVSLAAFAQLLAADGQRDAATAYRAKADGFAATWLATASDPAGRLQHSKLQFNLNATWSQKYNLLFDKVLGLGVFPQRVYATEEEFYVAQALPYGVPLDNRHPYTKSDWSMWSAAIASNQSTFCLISDALYKFAHETPNRVPFSDWYVVTSGKLQGFRARPVIGGIYAELLLRAWVGRGSTGACEA